MPPRIRVEGPPGTARAEDLIAAGGPTWRAVGGSSGPQRCEAGLPIGRLLYTRAVSSGAGRVSAALRLTGAVAVIAIFLIAHGVQCAAASPSVHGGAAVHDAMVIGLSDGVGMTGDAAVSTGPQPAGPAHTAGHAAAVCFAVIAAAVVLLLRRGLNWSVAALARSAPRRLASARIAVDRLRANAPPLSILCASRT